MSKTILCDMDGILVAIHKKWYDAYNQKYGDDLCMEKVVTWDTHLYAKHGKAVYEVLGEPGFFRDVPPIPGALEGIQTLQKAGHRVVIVTAASRYAATDKLFWLEKYAPWFDRKEVLIGHPKELVRGDALIDDGPHNIQAHAAAWKNTKLYAIAYPHNRHIKDLCRVYAEDWTRPQECWGQIVEDILQTP